MRARKTVTVEQVRELGNRLLAIEDNAHVNADFRKGVAAVLETILHETGNYAGFNFLDWLRGGYEKWIEAGAPKFPEKAKFLGDESKRVYFARYSPALSPAKAHPKRIEDFLEESRG